MIINVIVLIALSSATYIHGLSGTEPKGTPTILYGTLMSNENNTFTVTNISIGKNRESTQKILLYEKPEKPLGASGKIMFTVNPFKDLTTTDLDLLKVSSIEVPEPHVSWVWKPAQDERSKVTFAHEFIEVIISWNGRERASYLIELGTESTTTPLKIFCDTLDTASAGAKPNDSLFCTGLDKKDLIKKGAPFTAIKRLDIKGNCYQLPQNAGTLKK